MKRFLLLLVALVFSASACNSPTEPYAAKVNGQEISVDSINDQLAAMTSSEEYEEVLETQLLQGAGGLRPGGPNTYNAQFAAGFLYDQVTALLVDEEIERLNIAVTPEDRAATEARLREQAAGQPGTPNILDILAPTHRDYVIDNQTKLNAVLARRNSEEAQRAYYEANRASFEEVCFRQTSSLTPSQVPAVQARLASGEDFALVARETFGAQQPTDAAGQPVDPAEPQCLLAEGIGQAGRQILDPIPTGQVSQPIQISQDSSAFLQITSRSAKSFEEVRPTISERLGNRTELFNELLANADVEVNPRYGELQRPGPNQQRQVNIYPLDPVALRPAAADTGIPQTQF